MSDPLDIKAKAPFPAGWLGNFAAHRFVLDEVPCASMEGFLQSLKTADPTEQARICGLSGPNAQAAGRRHDWSVSGSLWWRGEAVNRLSDADQAQLDRAYDALCTQSECFRAALAATGTAPLIHRSGKSDPCETILTDVESCSRLTALRSRLADPIR